MLAANQHFNVTQQLDDGIRLLQSQGHKLKGAASNVIELCHTTCDMFSPYQMALTVDWMLDRSPHIYLKSKTGYPTTLANVFRSPS